MPEWLQADFMQRAVLAGVIVSVLASYCGVFVVQRGLSFLGSGLAHAAFGGVALGLLLEAKLPQYLPPWVDPIWIALPFTVLIALAITWVQNRTTIGGDTSVGVFFSMSVALGVLFISVRDTYATDAMSYLFGNITLVDPSDLWLAGGLLVVCLVSFPLWSKWAYATFDRDLAKADHVHVHLHDYLLTVLIAVIVVVSVKLVGIVMIAAFLVIPPAAARVVSRTFAGMTACAVAISIVTTLVGLRFSHAQDIPSGATIILVQAGVFFLAMIVAALRKRPRLAAAPRDV